jgi:hypothetical protein
LLVASAADKATAQRIEETVRAAWIRWYREALESVLRLPPAGATDPLRQRIALATQRVR